MPDNLSASELVELRRLLSALQLTQNDLPLAQLVALLTVAAEPGLSVNDLADRTNTPQQTASRHAAILLGRYESVASPAIKAPLIAQGVSEDDPRRRALTLTLQGKQLLKSLLGRLKGDGE